MNKTCKALLWIAALAATSGASAHVAKHKGITIVHPWVAPSGDVVPAETAVYMKITNTGKAPDRLLSASSPRAAKAELRGSDQPDARAVVSVELRPGQETRPNVRLLGLNKPLTTYDTFPMTLVFEKAGRFDIEVMVEE